MCYQRIYPVSEVSDSIQLASLSQCQGRGEYKTLCAGGQCQSGRCRMCDLQIIQKLYIRIDIRIDCRGICDPSGTCETEPTETRPFQLNPLHSQDHKRNNYCLIKELESNSLVLCCLSYFNLVALTSEITDYCSCCFCCCCYYYYYFYCMNIMTLRQVLEVNTCRQPTQPRRQVFSSDRVSNPNHASRTKRDYLPIASTAQKVEILF